MQLDAPATANERRARDRWQLPRGAAVAVASCALVLAFAAAGAPIPLYTTYGHADGLIHEAFATTAVGYFVAAAIGWLRWGACLGLVSDAVIQKGSPGELSFRN